MATLDRTEHRDDEADGWFPCAWADPSGLHHPRCCGHLIRATHDRTWHVWRATFSGRRCRVCGEDLEMEG